MPPIPLEQVALRTDVLGLRVEAIVCNHRDLAAVRRLEEPGDLVELGPRGADVVFQPLVVSWSAAAPRPFSAPLGTWSWSVRQ